MSTPELQHCDVFIDDETQPECLRRYLGWARLPAICKYAPSDFDIERFIAKDLQPHVWKEPIPTLFATHDGKRVRVTMASRFGDVGITTQLDKEFGYETRVAVSELTDFSETAVAGA